MNEPNKINTYRVLWLVSILGTAFVSAGIVCWTNQLGLEEILCSIFVIIGFMLVFFFELAYERRRKMIADNRQTDYSRIATGFILSCVVMIFISFLPEFYRPVMLISLIMTAYSNEILGITTALFVNCVLAMTTGGSYNELLTYILLSTIAAICAKMLKNKEYRIYIVGILFFLNLMFSSVFYFWNNETIGLIQIGYGCLSGAIVALCAYFWYPKEIIITEQEIEHCYDGILADDYSQVKEIKGYSFAEYRHARKVSDIVYKYAHILGLHASLASAAGFYYRLGRLEGEPVALNGVKRAYELCFPEEMIQILREYNGELQLPSTPESALIHIVDGVLIKIELLEKELGTSQWNREVLIHQTMNEFSTQGLYDQSGLSINAFIKIRELLAKEELLS